METHGSLQLPSRSFHAFSMLIVLSPHTGQQSRATVQRGLAAALLGCPQGSAAWCSTLRALRPHVVPHSTPMGKAGDVWRRPLVPLCYWGPAAPTLPVVHRTDMVVGECHGIPGENESGVTATNLGTAPGLPAGHCTLPSPGFPEQEPCPCKRPSSALCQSSPTLPSAGVLCSQSCSHSCSGGLSPPRRPHSPLPRARGSLEKRPSAGRAPRADQPRSAPHRGVE